MSADQMDVGEYVCTLTEDSIKKAVEQLHENPNERMGVLKTFRDWIGLQQWLQTPVDSKFLLAFLRSRKFSQLGARELLKKYWMLKTKVPQWHYGVDPLDTKVKQMIKTGVMLKLPGVDKNGCKVLLLRPGKLDSSGREYSFDEWMGGNTLILDTLLLDENTQVNGVVFLMDFTGFTLKHQIFVGIDVSKILIQTLQSAMPCRVKELHHYNTGPVFEALFAIIRPIMTEKLRKRMRMHGCSLISVYSEIGMSMLPAEYLPDDYEGTNAGSIEDITEHMLEEIQQPHMLRVLTDYHSNKYGINLSTMPKVDPQQASYRKLTNT